MSGKNLLVINVDIREVRVALIENGILAELHLERLRNRHLLGNIYLGGVSRVLPGMQAAFIDVGEERAAFLHVEDLIHPDDFEKYLGAGFDDERSDEAGEAGASSEQGGNGASEEAAELADEPPPTEPDASDDEVITPVRERACAEEPGAGAEEVAARTVEAAEPDLAPLDPVMAGEAEALERAPSEEASPEAPAEETEEDGADGAGAREEALPADDAPREGRGRRRRRKRSRVPRATAPQLRTHHTQAAGARRDGDRDAERGDGKGRRALRRGERKGERRISKHTPIREVVREGQQVIVQVSKEPIGTKGARVTSHVSLPGRYVVYLPTVDHVGVSKRIGNADERQRLRATIDQLRPPKGGLVVRTVAEGLTKKQLKQDIGYLVRLWEEIAKKREDVKKAPALIYEELDLVLRTARDLFTDDVERIIVDNREQFARLRRFVEMFMPERVGDIQLYEGREPIFDAYGIEDEIARSLARKVPLASGGYLIIDQAEALTAIDVNTGRYVGKGSKDLEETILQTNLEAVDEIAYQLRFRNIGGLIILDLIDMERQGNREKVRRRLEAMLARDKAKTTLNRISELGLIEMTRKRTRESLGRMLHEPCFYCDGTGQLMSKETIAYEILRQIRREQQHLKGYQITVNAHPAIIDLLQADEKEAVREIERLFARRVVLSPHKEYHLEQFDLQGL